MPTDFQPPSDPPVRSTECSANVARENGIKEIRYLCDEALDHQMGWKSFCEMVRHRLEIESVFVEMASSPNSGLWVPGCWILCPICGAKRPE